ncbi:uncharacterized protein LOC114273867 [Camellia sinensis]|uniref:uncharacterized protein LOC114273867 n=1 Tax=Camellia sinensis TaxID=4442 RepID=UPI00103678EA|nr:uncharacterized protein LOC114273867 [Camellia sinensis]
MAQEEARTARVNPLGDDDAVELAEQYRTERQVERVGGLAGPPRSWTLMAALKLINQAEPDHWHTKADKSTVTAGELKVEERANKEEEVLKKKKKRRVAPEGASDAPGSNKARSNGEGIPMAEEGGEKGVEATPEVVVALEAQEEKSQGVPEGVMESGSAVPKEVMGQQPQGVPAPQGEGARLTTAIYHARAVSGRLEGEEGPARAAADRLMGIVDDTAVRSVARFNEAELLRGLCSTQMEVTTLAGALLRKAVAAKVKSEDAKAQLASFKKESASWKKAARSACARGWQEAEKAKKMEVLAIVQGNVANGAHAELLAVRLELEDEWRKVVSLEFQLAGEQKKLGDAQNACTVTTERFEEAMIDNEELRLQQIEEKDEAGVKIAGLQKELEDERAKAMEEKARLQKELQKELEEEKTKAASERVAYLDLCVVAVEQFKGSADFQMTIVAAVASNLASEVTGEASSSGTTAGNRTEAESDFERNSTQSEF